jgi:hypothetical protein
MGFLLLTIGIIVVFNAPAQHIPQTNQHFSYTLISSADSEKVWDIWVDVENWNKWDTGLQDASIKDTFKLNSEGTITSLEGRISKFRIVAFDNGKSYTIKTKLPLGSLYVKRYLKTEEDRTIFTHEVWFKGLTKGIFARAFGKKFKEMLPEVLENVKTIAEK